ncbi:MAG: hypothetical protein JJ975_03410 [Bacteroidia bacterium]|nr:hypothetical protein [Bacteroidia bacterium]
MKNIILNLALLILPCLSSGSQFKQCKFFIFKGHTYIETSVQGCETPVIFLFDLGTDHVSITNRLATEISHTISDSVTIKMGSIVVTSPFSFDDKARKSDSLYRLRMGALLDGKIFGGLVGNVVFNHDYIVLDFSSQILYREVGDYESISRHAPFPNEQWVPFVYDSRQIFVSCGSGDSTIGYFHIDNGIPDHNIINYDVAVKSGFKGLKNLPNRSGKLVSDTFYNNEGIPTHIRSGIKIVTNHDSLASSNHFHIGQIDVGLQFFKTIDTDFNQDIFMESNLYPIVGSIAYNTLKGRQLHIDFRNSRLALTDID